MFGPRGTGKTAWLRRAFPHAVWLDLLDPSSFRELSAKPERLLDIARAQQDDATIVIDEVQRVPEILPAVQLIIEERPQMRVVLTGSSARKLKRSSADLLAGRAIRREMLPFTASELGEDFDLATALTTGSIPLILTAQDPSEALRTYVALCVREEVQAEALVRNIGAFHRFLEAISNSHGSVINLSSVARDAEVERKVTENYVSILEDLLLAYRVQPFRKRERRRVVLHPKFFFIDAGVFTTLRPRGPMDDRPSLAGSALVGLVAMHLRALIAYSRPDVQLFFWRTSSGLEVDFVLYGPDCFSAIEVKSSERLRPQDFNGLRAFAEEYPEAHRLLLHRGERRFVEHGILCLPVEEFLKEPARNLTP